MTNVTDLFSYEGNLTYNPNILNCTSCEEGPFLGTAGLTWWLDPVIDNYNGWIFFGNTLWFPPLASGNGTLATITFDVLATGNTALNFSETDLNTQDEEGVSQDIPHDKENGFFFSILGDVNGDGTVDASDLSDLNTAYGSDPSKPNWTQHSDFNGDDKVGSSDLFILGKNYGKDSV